MQKQLKKALGFGLTSGVVTTLGSMIGIASSTNSARTVLVAIYTIALADSLSDAMGVHSIEETDQKTTSKKIWSVTVYTFLFKFLFAISFTIPVYFFSLSTALIISMIWGVIILTIFSIYLAKQRKVSIFHTISEHIIIGIVVVVCSYFLGIFLNKVL